MPGIRLMVRRAEGAAEGRARVPSLAPAIRAAARGGCRLRSIKERAGRRERDGPSKKDRLVSD